MTNIRFFKVKDVFVGFEASGHTGYSTYNKDVLCASISSILESCALGIIKVLHINATLDRNDDNGYIKIELPKDINEELLSKSQVLFNTAYESILDLYEGYSKYISMEVIENVY